MPLLLFQLSELGLLTVILFEQVRGQRRLESLRLLELDKPQDSFIRVAHPDFWAQDH